MKKNKLVILTIIFFNLNLLNNLKAALAIDKTDGQFFDHSLRMLSGFNRASKIKMAKNGMMPIFIDDFKKLDFVVNGTEYEHYYSKQLKTSQEINIQTQQDTMMDEQQKVTTSHLETQKLINTNLEEELKNLKSRKNEIFLPKTNEELKNSAYYFKYYFVEELKALTQIEEKLKSFLSTSKANVFNRDQKKQTFVIDFFEKLQQNNLLNSNQFYLSFDINELELYKKLQNLDVNKLKFDVQNNNLEGYLKNAEYIKSNFNLILNELGALKAKNESLIELLSYERRNLLVLDGFKEILFRPLTHLNQKFEKQNAKMQKTLDKQYNSFDKSVNKSLLKSQKIQSRFENSNISQSPSRGFFSRMFSSLFRSKTDNSFKSINDSELLKEEEIQEKEEGLREQEEDLNQQLLKLKDLDIQK